MGKLFIAENLLTHLILAILSIFPVKKIRKMTPGVFKAFLYHSEFLRKLNVIRILH